MVHGSDVVVALRGVTMAFGAGAARVEALRGIDLEVRRGEFVAVTGPSGSGKSTMLHLMAGLARPTAGVVEVDGTDLVALDDDALTRVRRRRIGIVFQAYNLLPVLTALENVALPLELDGVPRATAAERAAAGLARVGLAARAGHLPSELSGGEQQRVAVARALVTSPAVLLADEPTGNLDSANGAAVMALLRSLADDGATLVMVTHEPEEAASARRQVRLVDGRVASDAATAAP